MTPEQLAIFMMYEWRECDFTIPPWDEIPAKWKADAIRVSSKILKRLNHNPAQEITSHHTLDKS